jgi:cytoskeleton protein RodZ
MSAFVGRTLRETRQARGLTLEEIAQATHIRLHFLQAMEAGDFDALPSPVQVKGFLRSYAGYLNLDAGSLLATLGGDSPQGPGEESKELPDPTSESADTPLQVPVTRFEDVGQRLRAQREVLGLSINEVERHTHLRVRYLEALEEGDMANLPSPVQGRGMLNNYAEFLGLDPEPLLLLFAEGLQSRLVERQPQAASSPREAVTRSVLPKRRRLTRDILIGGLLVIGLIAFSIWGILRVTATRAGTQTLPTPPSIADVLLPSATATQVPTLTPTLPPPPQEQPAEDVVLPTVEETQIVLLPPNADGPIRVQIVIQQRAWMRVSVDGEIAFEGRVIPGSAYAFAGDEIIEILTGSGSALQLFYNDQDLGVLGRFGEVIDYVITIDGVQTPTPTITFTPTLTDTPEATPTLTPTP